MTIECAKMCFCFGCTQTYLHPSLRVAIPILPVPDYIVIFLQRFEHNSMKKAFWGCPICKTDKALVRIKSMEQLSEILSRSGQRSH